MINSNASVIPFKSGHTLAQVVSVLLLVDIVVYLIAIALGFSHISLLSRILTGEQITPDETAANQGTMQPLEMPQRLAQLITGVCFLVWIYRAHRNLPALGARNLGYSPGWAVGGFFVPLLNLVRPYQVVREIWKASSPEVGVSNDSSWQNVGTSPLLGIWWGTFIVMNILGQAVLWLSPPANTVEAFLPVAWLGVVSYVVGVIAAVLALFVVRELDTRQVERFSHLIRCNSV
jgi:hypothetical protein